MIQKWTVIWPSDPTRPYLSTVSGRIRWSMSAENAHNYGAIYGREYQCVDAEALAANPAQFLPGWTKGPLKLDPFAAEDCRPHPEDVADALHWLEMGAPVVSEDPHPKSAVRTLISLIEVLPSMDELYVEGSESNKLRHEMRREYYDSIPDV